MRYLINSKQLRNFLINSKKYKILFIRLLSIKEKTSIFFIDD